MMGAGPVLGAMHRLSDDDAFVFPALVPGAGPPEPLPWTPADIAMGSDTFTFRIDPAPGDACRDALMVWLSSDRPPGDWGYAAGSLTQTKAAYIDPQTIDTGVRARSPPASQPAKKSRYELALEA